MGALVSNTGFFNTAVGEEALRQNTTGNDNTAVGEDALIGNTTGNRNTAMGEDALFTNTAGNSNTAVGEDALAFNTTGDRNTAVGEAALFSNTTGFANVAVGHDALRANTEGVGIVAVGDFALVNNTGSGNTAVGSTALRDNTLGINNTALGVNAGANQTTGSTNIYISNNGIAGENRVIKIGESFHTGGAFIAGVEIVPPSSRRFKQDIHDMDQASSGLMRLRPVTFRYKKTHANGERPLQYGLIAEEVEEVYPELVVKNEQGQVQTVEYLKLNSLLLNEVQKQHRLNQEQADQIQDLTEQLAQLKQILTAQRSLATVAE